MQDPDPVDIHVGARVRMRRMMLKLSQTELGNVAKVSFQQIQKYEKGNNRISSSRLQQFANVLQVPISFFFEGVPTKSNCSSAMPAHVLAFLAERDGLSLTKAFMKIKSGKMRRLVVDLVETIANEKT